MINKNSCKRKQSREIFGLRLQGMTQRVIYKQDVATEWSQLFGHLEVETLPM
jgi:hypothetical protein